MRFLYLLAILSGLAAIAHSQAPHSLLHPEKLVHQAHLHNTSFFKAEGLFQRDSDIGRTRNQFQGVVSDKVLLNLNRAEARYLTESAPEALSLPLPTPSGETMELELVQVELFDQDFFLNSDLFPEGIPYTPGQHYRGVVAGKPGSFAALSVFPDRVMGLFATQEEGNFVLGGVEDPAARGQHILYRDRDLVPPMEFTCETPEEGQQVVDDASPQRVTTNPCIKVYLEVDSSLTNLYFGVTGVTNFVTALFNQSATIFAMENLDYQISQIFAWEASSPYYWASPSTLLTIFKNQVTTLNGDLGHLLTNQSSGGVAAGFNGLCNPNEDLSLCVSNIVGSYAMVPTYSWPVNVVTHEMGHLNGSPHTHACAWNGNATAIDGCAGMTEGNCPVPGNPAGGGTIMSYCHNTGVGVNFALGFGTQPGNRIRNSAHGASCLTSCIPTNPGLTCTAVLDSFPQSESFETGFGDWINATGDDIDWWRNYYGTSTGGTGPIAVSLRFLHYFHWKSSSFSFFFPCVSDECLFESSQNLCESSVLF